MFDEAEQTETINQSTRLSGIEKALNVHIYTRFTDEMLLKQQRYPSIYISSDSFHFSNSLRTSRELWNWVFSRLNAEKKVNKRMPRQLDDDLLSGITVILSFINCKTGIS